MVTPKQTRTTVPGVMKTNLEGISLLVITISSICLLNAQKKKKGIFKKKYKFKIFYSKNKNSLGGGWGGGGGMKFLISRLLSLQMLHTKFGKDWPSSSCEVGHGRMTNDERRTQIDANRSPFAINCLGHSFEYLRPGMLHAKFGWNWSSGSGENVKDDRKIDRQAEWRTDGRTDIKDTHTKTQ